MCCPGVTCQELIGSLINLSLIVQKPLQCGQCPKRSIWQASSGTWTLSRRAFRNISRETHTCWPRPRHAMRRYARCFLRIKGSVFGLLAASHARHSHTHRICHQESCSDPSSAKCGLHYKHKMLPFFISHVMRACSAWRSSDRQSLESGTRSRNGCDAGLRCACPRTHHATQGAEQHHTHW